MRRFLVRAVVVSALVVAAATAPMRTSMPAHVSFSATPAADVTAVGGDYRAVRPARLIDTRTGLGVARRPVPAKGTLTVQVGGRDGVPTRVAAVAVTVHVMAGNAAGSLAAYSSSSIPAARIVDFGAGQRVADSMYLPLDATGRARLYNSSRRPVGAAIDVVGYFVAGSPGAGGYAPIHQARIVDTSKHLGANSFAGRAATTFSVGRSLPTTAVGAAIVLHVRSGAHAFGAFIPYATRARPNAVRSSDERVLHFRPGNHGAAFVIVPIGVHRDISVYNTSRSGVMGAVDIVGYVTAANPVSTGAYRAVTSRRILSTLDGVGIARHPLAGGASGRVRVAGVAGLPPNGISSVVATVHVVSRKASGVLRTAATAADAHGTTAIDFTAGQTIDGQDVVALDGKGDIVVVNGSRQPVDVVVDVHGYFYGSPPSRVTGLTVTSTAANAVTLTWSEPIDSRRSGITIRRGGFAAPTSATDGTGVAELGPTATSFTDYGANAGSTYTYAVFTHDSIPHAATGPAVMATTPVAPAGGTWGDRMMLAPRQGSLDDVSCPSSTFCAVADQWGNVMRYDGTSWTAPARVADESIPTISCVSDTWCVAGTNSGGVYAFDGSTWQASAQISTMPIYVISCATTKLCLAQDAHGTIYGYDGVAWTTATTAFQLKSSLVSCAPGTTDCMVLDFHGNWSLLHDGTWTDGTASGVSGLTGMSCATATFCMAVDFAGDSYEFDGASWTMQTGAGGHFDDVACGANGSCTAIDTGSLRDFDGSDGGWQGTAYGRQGFHPASISCAAANWCGSIDDSSAVTGGWPHLSASLVDPGLGGISALACTSTTFCGVLDSASRLMIYNGTTLSPTSASVVRGSGPQYASDGLICVADSLCVSEYGGSVTTLTRTGATWTSILAPMGGVYSIPACSDDSHCVAITAAGVVWTYSTGNWSMSANLGDHGRPYVVSCISATECVAISSGYVRWLSGTHWSAAHHVSVLDGMFAGPVRCTSDTFCVAFVENGRVSRYDGKTWSAIATPSGNGMSGLTCAATRCAAFDSYTHDMRTYDGSAWSQASPIDPVQYAYQSLDAVSCGSPTFCVAGDRDGALIVSG